MYAGGYNQVYIECAWLMLSDSNTNNTCKQYEHLLLLLIYHFEYSITHLVSSLYLLYQYKRNQVLNIDTKIESNLIVYLVLTSFILSNKLIDPKVYSLNTWYEVLLEIKSHSKTLKIDIDLLKSLEEHFLFAIDLSIDLERIENDQSFWNELSKVLTKPLFLHLREEFNQKSKGTKETIDPTNSMKNTAENIPDNHKTVVNDNHSMTSTNSYNNFRVNNIFTSQNPNKTKKVYPTLDHNNSSFSSSNFRTRPTILHQQLPPTITGITALTRERTSEDDVNLSDASTIGFNEGVVFSPSLSGSGVGSTVSSYSPYQESAEFGNYPK